MGLTKVSGDVIQGTINVGVVTATTINVGSAVTIHTGGFRVGSSDLHSSGLTVQNLNSTGVVTATTFSGNLTGNVTGNATGLSGTPNITVGAITAASATITGNVSVAGTVTYDDVTNVDSLGVGTFRSGIVVNTGTASTALVVNGSSRITGILSVGQGTITINGNTDKITTPKLDYAGISSTISDNAVDVFVYDTRKDSDGGAWRKRTQHTSWYNETLNTATRGSRRDFPAVAVIVMQASTLTIYDGDDPDMPMWIVFVNDGYLSWATGGTISASSVTALNGQIVVGVGPGNGGGIINFNFISDDTRVGYNSAYYLSKRTLIDRNNSNFSTPAGGDGYVLVNYVVNDVAMTVLPNAPIDSTTGLPVPTIAVATDGGASIINDNGNISNITFTDFTKVYKIGFVDTTKVYILNDDTSRRRFIHIYDIPTSTITQATNGYRIGSASEFYQTESDGVSPSLTAFDTSAFNVDVNDTVNRIYGTSNGIIRVDANTTSPGNGLLSIATTSYNTGWMHGDIKGAFLSDTSTTSVTGTTVYSDTFDNNNNGWGFADNGSSGISGGVLTIEQNGSARASDTDAFSGGTTGTKYALEVVIASGGTGNLQLDDDGIGAGLAGVTAYATYSSTGTFTAIITKTASNRLRFLRSSGTGNYTITSITIKPLQEADRSVNNNGLAVYGTISKTAVATGADLVAYSGFSVSNYLLQPYNSAIAFGTANFSYMGWAKATTAGGYLFQWDNPNSASGIRISMFNSTTVRLTVTSVVDRDITYSALTGTWNFFVVQRVGSIIYTYINGVQIDSFSNTTNLSGTDKVLTFGYNGNSTLNLALWRVSASAPSPDQIKKIYNDEKALFQDNSKATLYGTSSAVTALAYDDSTRLLYAGTSSGRSDFQGLERINNTTTAVTTAISASNGLVAEQ